MGNLTPFPGSQVARVPPCNDHAEQALLGAIMCSNQSYLRVAEFLKPEHFSNALHARIFAAAGRLIDAGQNAKDFILGATQDQATQQLALNQFQSQAAARERQESDVRAQATAKAMP